ncbi:hypothetical protein SAMN05421877_10962 [Sphingobacterium lactis]|uniref:Uncharacterized protein n=1 Tax=Sphingobacterium lactis TaxID=797291 RepID=A0A1H6AYY8_9SPHI|nr:hypothetical protein SAMN05421877_10962 [Sphingobacterium lactis]
MNMLLNGYTLSELRPWCKRIPYVLHTCYRHAITSLSVRSHHALMSDKVQH